MKSKETRLKMRLAKLGKKRPPFTLEHKEKIRQAMKGKGPTPEVFKLAREALKKLRGSKHWNWQGGLTKLSTLIRHSLKYRQWRSDIFTQDNFTCVLCDLRGQRLNADHYPKTFAQLIKENKIKTVEDAENCSELWNLNNGRTLCEPCHKNTETYLRKPKNV